MTYEIVTANRISPTNSGGKEVLLEFFRYLRRASFLHNDFEGKVTTTVIFVDKDIDDLERTLLRSDHVVYTESYQVENYIFMHGNLLDSAAATAGLDRNMILASIGNAEDWRRTRAQIWSEWIKLCVFIKTRRVPGRPNYRVTSPLNNPPLNPTDRPLFQRMLTEIEPLTGMSRAQFTRAFRNTSGRVNRLFDKGTHDKVFKGKWYAALMDAELRQVAAGRVYDNQRLPQRLLSTLAVTVDYNGDWAEHFKRAIQHLLA
jgi:hypothetical protein